MVRFRELAFNTRRLIQAFALGAAVIIGSGAVTAVSADVAADVGPGSTAPVRPFRLDQVRLGSGLLSEKRDRIKAFIQSYDERRFLVLFNNQANRPNPSGVSPPGVWEDGGLLSGHWAGHYLTALSQAYVDQGEKVFKTKLDWMVKELAACQDAITARMKSSSIRSKKDANAVSWIPTHPGYLGALPEDTVLRLGPPRWAIYGSNLDTNTWAPWYTQHKIMRGLLDAYYNTNNTQALDVVKKMANWANLALTIGDKNHPKYTGNLTRSDLNYMWDLYIGGEFGGANEVFPEIYELTGDARHLQTAKAFDNRESLFGAAVANNDILVVKPENIPGRRRGARLHANTHVPQFIGYMRIFEQKGGQEYFNAAKNFYGWVTPHRAFSHGGTGGSFPGADSNAELFQNRDNIANAIGQDGVETCTTYNMLKLGRNLFLHESNNATYMDNYERGLFNMITGSRADTSSTADPQLTYFQPLTPGAKRNYGNTGTCCGGTGMESHTKYQETVYLRAADNSALFVNLFVPSTLTWAEKGITVKQETKFPRGDTAKFTITGNGQLDIKLRVPAWARSGFQVNVNGQALSGNAPQPGTYLSINRTWKTGDVIDVRMPFSIRIERALDRPDTQSIMWGPILLQILGSPSGGTGSYQQLSLYQYLKRDGNYSRAAITQTGTSSAGDPLFKTATGNLVVRPYYISDTQATSSYFRRNEPNVVFGTINTGIANRKRNDGLPKYDVPVSGITSPGKDGPTFLDLVWDQAPFATHAAFVDTVTSVSKALVTAGVCTAAEQSTIIARAKEAEKELTP